MVTETSGIVGFLFLEILFSYLIRKLMEKELLILVPCVIAFFEVCIGL